MITHYKGLTRTLNFKKGFTLIELLVVIAIIGILASIILASLNSARAKARDVRRVADMDAVKKALVLYYDENQSAYPIDTTAATNTIAVALDDLVTDGFIPSLPTDPQDPTYSYLYKSDATGSMFWLEFCLETGSVSGYAQGCGNITTL